MLTTIALDYGDVLARPASGNWLMPPNLPEILGLGNMMKMMSNARLLLENTERAKDFLDQNHLLHTEEEEFQQFKEFFGIMFGGCGLKGLGKIAEELARYTVYNENKVRFYDDALPGIQALKERWRVIVISDAWPSLRGILARAGIAPLLDDLVISCDYGHSKGVYGRARGGGKLFQTAIEKHGVVPEETLFVDDRAENLAFARDLGFHTAHMDRDGKIETSEYPLVRTMEEVAALAAGLYSSTP